MLVYWGLVGGQVERKRVSEQKSERVNECKSEREREWGEEREEKTDIYNVGTLV